MATYNPPQPRWKRVIAFTLDFFLALHLAGLPMLKLVGSRSNMPNLDFRVQGIGFELTGWPAGLVLALMIGYFIVLGQTGGTVFQRLFGMRRA